MIWAVKLAGNFLVCTEDSGVRFSHGPPHILRASETEKSRGAHNASNTWFDSKARDQG